jgi:hypothetical protein
LPPHLRHHPRPRSTLRARSSQVDWTIDARAELARSLRFGSNGCVMRRLGSPK